MGNGLEPGDSIKATDTFKFFRGETAAVSPGDRDVPISKLVEYLNDATVLDNISGGGGGGNLTVTAIDNTDSPYTITSTDDVLEVDASGGDVAITLPAIASNSGREISFVRMDSTAANLVTISGDSNISGMSAKYLSLHAKPERGLFANLESNAATQNTFAIDTSDIISSGSLVVRGFWLAVDDTGTDTVECFSAVPNASNWDLTSLQSFSNRSFTKDKWEYFELTNAVTIASTELFVISLQTGTLRLRYTASIYLASFYFNAASVTGNQTNYALTASNTTHALVLNVEGVTQYDVLKLVGGSSQWLETIA